MRADDASNRSVRIAVLMTCHNRRELTTSSVSALARAADPERIKLALYLVDDGCTDGTADAVRGLRPDATIVQGSGDLYWNLGMRRAWQEALKAPCDFYLWLNDDLILEPGSIDRLVCLADYRNVEFGGRLVIIGVTISRATGRRTYGGYLRSSRLSRLQFRRREPADTECCDTMNGNCVLIPARAAQEVGINSQYYTHSIGDIDYGLRAVKNGYTLIEHPEPVGFQERNEKWLQSVSRLTLKNWRYILLSPKGIPVKEWLRFCQEYGGLLWPANFLFRYIKIAVPKRSYRTSPVSFK